jgi:hypothetical protein
LFFTIAATMIRIEGTRPHRSGRLKEAFDMTDRFSAGNVFYGRTLAIMGAVIALAIVIHLL